MGFLNRFNFISFGLIVGLIILTHSSFTFANGPEENGAAVAARIRIPVAGNLAGEGVDVTVIVAETSEQVEAAQRFAADERAQFQREAPSNASIDVRLVEPEGASGPMDSALATAAQNIAGEKGAVKREPLPGRVWKKITQGYRNLYDSDPARAIFTIVRPSSNAGFSAFSAIIWKGVPPELALPVSVSIFFVSGAMTYITPSIKDYLNSDWLAAKLVKKSTAPIQYEVAKFVEGMMRWSPIGLFFSFYPVAVAESTRALHGLAPVHPDWSVWQYAGDIVSRGAFSITARAVWELAYNREMSRGLKQGMRTENSVKWQAYSVQAIGSLMTAVAVTLPALGYPQVATTLLSVQTGGGIIMLLAADNDQFRNLMNRVYLTAAPHVARITQPIRRAFSCVAQLAKK